MTFSLATEFVENETYTDYDGNTYRKFDKQDCELKASYKLLKKIKQRFPKLPIIIGGDALYLDRPFLELYDEYKFDYIIRYKESGAPTIKRNLEEIKIVDGNYQYQNEIIFGELKDKDFYTVNVISYDEEVVNEETDEITIKNFSYATS
ncbi:MAG: hypothetical protein IJY25_04915 [Bacilli bacterium]|nr:hypothetical protein [Bacilli bacterium]